MRLHDANEVFRANINKLGATVAPDVLNSFRGNGQGILNLISCFVYVILAPLHVSITSTDSLKYCN